MLRLVPKHKCLSTHHSPIHIVVSVLTTPKVISGRVPTCNIAAPLGDQVNGNMIRYPTHYPETVLTSSHSILLMLSVRLGSDKHHIL